MANTKQSTKESIKLLDDAYRIIMDLIKGDSQEDFLYDVKDILSSIDDVQNKIELLEIKIKDECERTNKGISRNPKQ
jgi:hypothetical protein